MIKRPGELTWREINEQAEAVDATLKQLPRLTAPLLQARPLSRYGSIIFTGCGSSYCAGMIAGHAFARLTRTRGIAVPASELLLYPEIYLDRSGENLAFVVSRTGETTEVLVVMRELKRRFKLTTVGLTCYQESGLVRAADLAVVLAAGREESIVMTKAFSVLLLGLLGSIVELAGLELPAAKLGQIPAAVKQSLEANGAAVMKLGSDRRFSNFAFLGSGPFYGLAREAMLKLKEMAAVPAMAYHTMEFRHGPKALIDEKSLVIIFSSERERQFLSSVLGDVHKAGGKALVIGQQLDGLAAPAKSFSFNLSLDDHFQPLVYIHLAHLLGYARALENGFDPDRPRHLTRVVTI